MLLSVSSNVAQAVGVLWSLSILFYFTEAKESLKLAAILPKHDMRARYFTGALRVAEKIHNPRLSLTKNYTLSGNVIFMKSYSPPEILNETCEKVIREQVNVLVYMSNLKYKLVETKTSTQYIFQIARFLGIPVISWIADNSAFVQPSADSNVLQLTPSIRHQAEAMLAFLRRYNWRSFSIVAGPDGGRDEFISSLTDLVDNAEDWYEILTIVKLVEISPAAVEEGLRQLSVTESRVTLLYASENEAEVIFEKAKKLGFTGKENVWICSNAIVGILKESRPPREFPVGLIAIYFDIQVLAMKHAVTNAFNIWSYGQQAMVTEMLKNPALNYTLKPSLDCLQSDKMPWKDGHTLLKFMKKVSIMADKSRERIEFNEDGTLKNVTLKLVNLKANSRWQEVGRWRSSGEVEIDDITWPGDELTPPKGRPAKYHLRAVTFHEDPYVVYSDPDPKLGTCPRQAVLCRIAPLNETLSVPNATTNSSLYQCCSGFCIDLLKMLGEKIGFDFELFEVEDKKWGAFDKEKGEWNGLVRTIMDGKADMTITSLKITPERNQQIAFSVPFLETGITIVVAVRDGVISPTAFLEPYDYPSWCLILVFSVHASGAAIFIFEWLSPSGLDRGNKPIREHRFSLFRSFWLIWSMLFGAAVNVDNPRGISSRFLANIWALFAVVFTASYTANLAAFMITKEDYDRLTGIQDWRLLNPHAHKPPFKFATVPHGSTETNLMKIYPKMYTYMKKYNKSSVKAGVRAVKEGEINAFIYDATVLEHMSAHDDGCKLRTVGNWYAMTGYGIGFPKGSKWIQIINKFMVQFQYNGELERLQKFWMAGACKKNKKEGESSLPLGILNFTSAFILLAGGMLLGGLLMLLEHTYFKFFRVRLRKWDKCGCCGLVSLSMGKSLTFEQSVREAIDMQRHHRCKDPLCRTHTWNLKHDLNLAMLKIDRLQKQLRKRSGLMIDKGGGQHDRPPKEMPPALGWKPWVLPKYDPSQPRIPNAWQPDSTVKTDPPQRIPPELNKAPFQGKEVRNRKGSKSLPSSPIKRAPPLVPPPWPPEEGSIYPMRGNGPMDLASNAPHDMSSTHSRPEEKKTKYHKGNVYIGVNDDPRMEKETVL